MELILKCILALLMESCVFSSSFDAILSEEMAKYITDYQ